MKKLAEVKNFFYSSFSYIRGRASIPYFINSFIIKAVSFSKKINKFFTDSHNFYSKNIVKKDLPIILY